MFPEAHDSLLMERLPAVRFFVVVLLESPGAKSTTYSPMRGLIIFAARGILARKPRQSYNCNRASLVESRSCSSIVSSDGSEGDLVSCSQGARGGSSGAPAGDSHTTCVRLDFFAKGPSSIVVELLVSASEHLSTVSGARLRDDAGELASAPGFPLTGLGV
ncbi:hypothetical protein KC325_g248 [Hortaea werneckii]|nr:hypothetical protein KC325_g248 [Hortaea werneckii]